MAFKPAQPKLAARVKNSQGKGGGIKQAKGGAKFVSGGKTGGGLKQNSTGARPGYGQAKGNKLNKKPVMGVAQKTPGKATAGHNSVTRGDVARLHKAAGVSLAPGAVAGSGSFKKFIGGK